MNTDALLGLTVAAALLAVLLRHRHPEQGLLLSLAAGVLVLVTLLGQVTPLLDSVRALLQDNPVGGQYADVLLKGVGICLLTQAAADTCRDAGENALAGKAELVGKTALLLLALPLFEQVLTQALDLMKGLGQ